jgi:hypothetical protein
MAIGHYRGRQFVSQLGALAEERSLRANARHKSFSALGEAENLPRLQLFPKRAPHCVCRAMAEC